MIRYDTRLFCPVRGADALLRIFASETYGTYGPPEPGRCGVYRAHRPAVACRGRWCGICVRRGRYRRMVHARLRHRARPLSVQRAGEAVVRPVRLYRAPYGAWQGDGDNGGSLLYVARRRTALRIDGRAEPYPRGTGGGGFVPPSGRIRRVPRGDVFRRTYGTAARPRPGASQDGGYHQCARCRCGGQLRRYRQLRLSRA